MKLEAQVWSWLAEEEHMAALTKLISITATLKSVWKRPDEKFRFSVLDLSSNNTGALYVFLLSKEKALKLANANSEFPNGAALRLSGRISRSDKRCLNFVKIHAVDGHDMQAWAERSGSPGVDSDVLTEAQKKISEAEEEAMRNRAPPEPPRPSRRPRKPTRGQCISSGVR